MQKCNIITTSIWIDTKCASSLVTLYRNIALRDIVIPSNTYRRIVANTYIMDMASKIPITVFLWGLTGGFSHCIGMCGVFVAAYTLTSENHNRAAKKYPVRHALFHMGRLISLISLGAIAGLIGDIERSWITAQGVISIAAGILLLCLALGYAGIVRAFRIPEPDIMGAGGGALRRRFVRALKSSSPFKPLIIGIFVGLLPCGLTYQALIPAALSGSIVKSMMTMAFFGLGTIPGLLTLGLFGGAILGGFLNKTAFRNRMANLSAIIMVITGIALIYRGI